MKIRPLHDRILVKRLGEQRVSQGGIVIPDAVEKPVQGTVVAVGKGKILDDGTTRPLDTVVGDKIVFGKYIGTVVRVSEEEMIVMREEDVMAVFPPEPVKKAKKK